MFLTVDVEEPVSGLPKELSKRAAKKYPILFRCAKRSILPSKAETSQKRMRSFYSQNSTAQSHKMGYFLAVLSPIVFVQSAPKTFTVAVYSKFYKLAKKDLKKRIIHYFFVLCYREVIFENSYCSGVSSNPPT